MPSALLNTPDKHFTTVAARLKTCLSMVKVTCDQTEKDRRTPPIASCASDLSASAAMYVIVGLGREKKITLRATLEAP
jgi:hypothetical protein